METRIDQEHLEIRKPVQVGSVERVHLGLRLLQTRAGLEPANVLPVIGMAHFPLFRAKRRWHPESDLGIDKVEARRHHTHYGERLSTHTDVFSERRLRAPEESPTQVVAQNGFLLASGLAFGIGKSAAVSGRYPQQPEQGRSRHHAGDALLRTLDLNGSAGGLEQRLLRENADLTQAVVIVTRGAVIPEIGTRLRVTIRHQKDRAGI